MRKVRLCIVISALLVSAAAGATRYSQNLPSSTKLLPNDIVNTGTHCLIQQTDGNLVLYKGSTVGDNLCQGTPVWWTGARGAYTFLQQDGKLVQFDSNDKPVWWSTSVSLPFSNNYSLSVGDPMRILDEAAGKYVGDVIYASPPAPPSNGPCPGGGQPALYTVCVNPNFMSRMTYRFQACSAREAQQIASNNGWSWGACKP